MATITINGCVFTGDRISINRGVLLIDGVETKLDSVTKTTHIKVEGVLHELKTDAPVTCGDVTGSVTAGGPVTAGNVGGDVKAGGPVSCQNVGGSVNAGGPVRMG